MLYTSEELRSFNCDLRPPNRRTRKTLFKLQLWLPRITRSATYAYVQPTDTILSGSHLGTRECQQSSKHLLKFATWNACSIGNKFLSITEFISTNHLDLFCLTESWHKDSSDVAVLRSIPPGYRCVDVPRRSLLSAPSSRTTVDASPRGGGVILYFREHFVVKKIDVIAGLKSFEYVCVSISTPRGPVTVVVIYRPGSVAPDATFIQEFSSMLEVLATYNSQLVIAGDLNIHFEDPTNNDTIQVNRILSSFALTQHVVHPTHNRGGILDVIITRSDCCITDLRVDPPALSDHGPVFCAIPFAIPAAPVFTSRQVRGWNKLDHDTFRAALQSGPLCQDVDSYRGMSAEQLFQLYDDTLRTTLDEFIPRHEVKSRSSYSTPWFDDECRSTKRRVRLLERRFRRTRSDTDRLAWITGIRDKHTFFKEKESMYWEHVVTSNASDSKKLWRSVSTMLGKSSKQQTTLPKFSASDFLSFLESKVEAVRSSTSGAPPPAFTSTDCHLGSFELCSQIVVERTIKSSPGKCCELDPAPTFLVKECLANLSPFLTLMCNASIQEGLMPSSQKEAIITPALKKFGLDTDDMKNYRPISNLSFMSKVVEKLIFQQLSVYLVENNLFPKLQSGFRRFHSTESAVLQVLSDIYSAIDRGDVALLALLDVSAAFDTVDHSILLERLSTSYGLSGPAYLWFESYISGRTQSVRLGGTSSHKTTVRFGIPQGSVLGPILYVLYTADIAKIVESLGFRVHLYADDTQVYGSTNASRSVELADHLLLVIDRVKAWMSSNRLRLNPDKTDYIWFGTRQQLSKLDQHLMSVVILSASTSVRDLGVILDSELTMEGHVSKLCQACFFQLRRLRAIRHSLSRHALLTLVHAFISSRLDFCNSVLYGVSTYILDRLQSILNAAARLILNIPKYGHISAAIREELHWLPVSARIQYKICLLVRNCLTGAAPVYLAESCRLVSSDVGRRHLRSAARTDLIEQRFRLERYGRRGFPVSGPYLWNQLPVEIRNLQIGADAFKKRLKTHLMQQHSSASEVS